VNDKLEILLGKKLMELGWKIATAESCTGGLVSHRLTNVPGSSNYFPGGVVAYSYEAKTYLLDVSMNLLNQRGAVSREVVLEMAAGVCDRFSAEVGLAVSGIAGPGGGTNEKPVGLAWVGLQTPAGNHAARIQTIGSRLENKEAFADFALEWTLARLEEQSISSNGDKI
jgi:PncC family amidohydrolase